MAKETLSVRISSEAMQRLALLIEARGSKSAGVVIEALLMDEPGPAPRVDPEVRPASKPRREVVLGRPDPDKIAAAQDWLKKPGRKR